MPKLRLIGLTLLALSAATVVHAEEKRYVSDELNTWVRSGPGDNYRLVGTINAGEEVVLLQSNAESNYGQVRDSSGRTAWIPLKELSTDPSLRTSVSRDDLRVGATLTVRGRVQGDMMSTCQQGTPFEVIEIVSR